MTCVVGLALWKITLETQGAHDKMHDYQCMGILAFSHMFKAFCVSRETVRTV